MYGSEQVKVFPTESALTMNDLCAAGTQNI